MINIIWVIMFVIGVVFAALNGRVNEVNAAIFSGGKDAVQLVLSLVSVLVFWVGIMRIAEKSGLLEKFVAFVFPLVAKLFPEVPKNDAAMGYIVSNMVANLFGLGNAATPLGIKAMGALKRLNNDSDEVSRSMTTFLAINTASITLIPTTVIGIRMANGAAEPNDIILATICAQGVSMIFAVCIDRYFYFRRMAKQRK
ncbi:MAG: nucleoside recognition domain-containing protein [Bacilli bacterium]